MYRVLLGAFLLTILSAPQALAQPASLDYGDDYTYAGEVHGISTVKVAPNRIGQYLAGLQRSWVSGRKLAVEMGFQKDYKIYVSELASSGDFNVMLVDVFEDAAQRHRFDDPDAVAELMERAEELLSDQEGFEITEGYTRIREINGQYLMREVEWK